MSDQTREPCRSAKGDKGQTGSTSAASPTVQKRRKSPAFAGVAQVVVRGEVRVSGTGTILFNAAIVHPLSGMQVLTSSEGYFEIRIPAADFFRSPLLVVAPPPGKEQYWPLTRRFTQAEIEQIRDSDASKGNAVLLIDLTKMSGPLALVPVPESLWKLPTLALLHVWGYFRTSNPRTRLLHLLLVALLVPVLALLALDGGLPIPKTDADELMRELLQRLPYYPSFGLPVRFNEVRRTYFSGVRYELPSGEYRVKYPVVNIEPGAELVIRPRTRIKMGRGSRIECCGTLKVDAERAGEVWFEPANPQEPWGNICFLGPKALGSSINFARIQGGSGAASIGSDSGFFDLVPTGSAVGGGILIYDSYLKVSNTIISNCGSRYGGAVYIRNRKPATGVKPIELPGPEFVEVEFDSCTAAHPVLAGGGAVFVKGTFPVFDHCVFRGNESKGNFSCGGALYLGEEARARVVECRFEKNTAEAQGGAIYALKTRDVTDGVSVIGGGFAGNCAQARGGALSVDVGPLLLDKVTFQENRVTGYRKKPDCPLEAMGGAVCVFYEPGCSPACAQVRIRGCKFLGNAVKPDNAGEDPRFRVWGGALSLYSESEASMQLTNLEFQGNTCNTGDHISIVEKGDSGAISGLDPTFAGCVFDAPGKNDKNAIHQIRRALSRPRSTPNGETRHK